MIPLSNIILPSDYGKKQATGIDALDQIFGDDAQTDTRGFSRSKVYLISAPGGTGKSRLFLNIQHLLIKNDPSIITGYFTAEEDELALKRMLDCMDIETNQNQLALESDNWSEICQKTIAHNIQFVVIDSLPLILDSFPKITEHGNDSRDMKLNEKIKTIKKFAGEHGITIILINHCDKKGNWKGSSTIHHLVDVNITMKKGDSKTYNGEKVVEFIGLKNREGNMINRAFPFVGGRYDFSNPIDVVESGDEKPVDKTQIVIDWFNENKELTREQLDSKVINLPEYIVKNILRDLVTKGILKTETVHGGGRGKPMISKWILKEVVDSQQ